MATTIKLKNGSGAPLAGDLVQGEPALDLTNKRLYTEDSGGTVIEVGTNPTSLTTGTFTSTGIDDNATSTAITIDSSENVGIGTTSPEVLTHLKSSDNTIFEIESTTATAYMKMVDSNTTGAGYIGYVTNDMTFWANNAERMRIDSSGNVGIGITNPAADLVVAGSSSGEYDALILRNSSGVDTSSTSITFEVSAGTHGTEGATAAKISGLREGGGTTGALLFHTTASGVSGERMRIDSSGNVGIGTSSPARILHVEKDGLADLLLRDTSSYSVGTGPAVIFQGNDSGGTTTQFGAIYGVSNGSNSGELTFETRNSGSSAERMRIDSSGNVGIGTTSPSYKLTIGGNSDSANNVLTGSGIVVGTTIGLRERGNTAGIGGNVYASQIYQGNSGGGDLELYNVSSTYSLVFGTNTTERMRIDSSGDVGIGIAPVSGYGRKLQVHSAAGGGSSVHITDSSTGSTASDGLELISFGSAAYIWNREASFMSFGTSAAERMRIDSSGNLLVGTTSLGGNSGRFQAVRGGTGAIGYFEINNGGGAQNAVDITNAANAAFVPLRFWVNGYGSSLVGSISCTTSATTYNTSSDQRLKDNIVDAPAGNIDAIRVRSFDWKADGSHQTYGMVAQELVDVAPEAVSQGETEDDMWGVDYSKLVPMMIKEIQDLKAEVAALKGE